jgi:LysM repeat protein
MKAFRELFTGLGTTLASTVLVIGAIFLAITEGSSIPLASQMSMVFPTVPTIPVATTTSVATNTPKPSITTVLQTSGTASNLITQTIFPSESPTSTETVTGTPTAQEIIPTTCAVPLGWQQYTVQAGDTLDLLALNYRTTRQQIMNANCLISESLLPGTTIYVPQLQQTLTTTLQATLTPTSCTAPEGWGPYYVQRGDSLFRISDEFKVSIVQLQAVNCLKTTTILVGQILLVPGGKLSTPVPTITPRSTPTPLDSPTPFSLSTKQVTSTPVLGGN